MYNPLEDERVQLGVIALASISIVAFLTSIAWERTAEISPPLRPVVTEPTAGSEATNSGAAAVAETPRPSATPVTTVGAEEESVAPLRAALQVDTPTAEEASVRTFVQLPKARPKGLISGRRATVRLRKSAPEHFSSAMNKPNWQGPLPNKKSDAP